MYSPYDPVKTAPRSSQRLPTAFRRSSCHAFCSRRTSTNCGGGNHTALLLSGGVDIRHPAREIILNRNHGFIQIDFLPVQCGQFTDTHSGIHERFYDSGQLLIAELIEEGHQFLALPGIKVKALLFLSGRCSSVRDRVFKKEFLLDRC